MMPNSPNQSTAASAGGGAGVSPAPYPQEQPPDITRRSAVKDPSGGDVGNTNSSKAAQQAQNSQPKTNKATASKKPSTDQASKKQSTATQEEQLPPNYQESAVIPGLTKPQPEELFFEWQAKSRPFKKHNRQFFTSVGVIGLLMALILIFAGQWLPMAVVIAVVFVIYVFNTIEPGVVLYQFTTYGIRVGEELYYWEEMGRFWFTKKYGEDILNIEIARFPNRLSILTAELSKDDLTDFMSEILLNQQPPPTTNDKILAWLQRKFPFDLDS